MDSTGRLIGSVQTCGKAPEFRSLGVAPSQVHCCCRSQWRKRCQSRLPMRAPRPRKPRRGATLATVLHLPGHPRPPSMLTSLKRYVATPDALPRFPTRGLLCDSRIMFRSWLLCNTPRHRSDLQHARHGNMLWGAMRVECDRESKPIFFWIRIW